MHFIILPFVFSGLYAKIKNKKMSQHLSLTPGIRQKIIQAKSTEDSNQNKIRNGGNNDQACENKGSQS